MMDILVARAKTIDDVPGFRKLHTVVHDSVNKCLNADVQNTFESCSALVARQFVIACREKDSDMDLDKCAVPLRQYCSLDGSDRDFCKGAALRQ